jgi:hypothetical protein
MTTASHSPVMPGVDGARVREQPATTATSISAHTFTVQEFMAKASREQCSPSITMRRNGG